MIKGFSKLSAKQKVQELTAAYGLSSDFNKTITQHIHPDLQEKYNQFSENTISNFYMPFGVAPSFVINNKEYAIPMVIEESSVVAAASKAAKFWSSRGGFRTKVISSKKAGQLFFKTDIAYEELILHKSEIDNFLINSVKDITASMEKRGGGILGMDLLKENTADDNLFCLLVDFETKDSMGANFINSCLEAMGEALKEFVSTHFNSSDDTSTEIIMAILSNYTPECVVECTIECSIDELTPYAGSYSAADFALRFKNAVDIANTNTHRAVTHNKGIMNGIDAVVLATGNDFRAIEAGVHAYAAQNGKYLGLTEITLDKNNFKYTLRVPLAVGTVGGLTKLHPMAKNALELLQSPNAHELMQIMAAAGMANNFSAIAALVTSGIQKGHMKMHLSNILEEFACNAQEKEEAENHFNSNTISHSAVKSFIAKIRS
ncbi:hydroxymethylglutaryl-CoA reductase [Saccharicrinis aurantiacus]|uniref:hydroxymethylglutaryl-CoA reductase n=1 Tax=Saccharicrinis aurantiacus TaxID=1849719 RepID=UPI002493714E|nr:hydroxymethylglutaryl-CoA reductase [Saccharicrinis aurantiacus]